MQLTITLPDKDVKKIKKMKDVDIRLLIIRNAFGDKVIKAIKEKKG